MDQTVQRSWGSYVVGLLRLLHDKLPHHGGAEFHQVGEDICSCCPHLQVVHPLKQSSTVGGQDGGTELPDVIWETRLDQAERTMMISRAGKMPRLARVLKNESLFCGCNVCENAQNSLTKFTWGADENRNNVKLRFQLLGNKYKLQQVAVWRAGRIFTENAVPHSPVLLTSSLLLLSSVASSVSCANTSVRNFSSSCSTKRKQMNQLKNVNYPNKTMNSLKTPKNDG